MTIRQMILKMMEDEKYKPMNLDELGKIFNVDKKGQRDLLKVLKSLETEKLIGKSLDDRYGLIDDESLSVEIPTTKEKKSKSKIKKEKYDKQKFDLEKLEQDDSLIEGILDANERGFGFVIPVEKTEDKDIFISSDNYNTAMNGDRVIVQVISDTGGDKRKEGKIIQILERKNSKIVGEFVDNKNFGFVIPDNNKLGYDIFIPKGKINKAKDKQKVVVEITKWPDQGRKPEGVVVEVLGYMSEAGTDILSIIRQYGLPEKFPKEVIKYVDSINQEVTEEDIKERTDLRNEIIMTMDGADAKDLDDAISIKKLENGHFKLGVHIADVSHYVKENSVLDKDAVDRGNSVYLLDRVIPMLPEELSNGICSLNPNEDRLCLSVTMEIDKNGKVVDSIIEETVINSKRRLVYDDVSDYLEDDLDQAREKLDGVLDELKLMEELAKLLSKKRDLRGSIDFDFTETRIILNKKGNPVDIVEDKRRIANKIIEEFMLITNETVAEQYFWAEIPFLYRIHDEPNEEKMEKFINIIHNLGYKLKGKQEVHPKALQQLLEEVKGTKEETLISTLMLRSLQKAVYSEMPNMHFGLASEHYSHFTAPIRRYPDLVIHRIIKKYIKGKLSVNNMKKLEKTLPEIADHTSMTERRAEEAEREVEDMKKAEYMVKYVGFEFDGVISSLTRFGIFVQLENTVEGLVRFATMRDDYYEFDEENYVVSGERGEKEYRLGDKVRVIVTASSPERRNIDFEIVAD